MVGFSQAKNNGCQNKLLYINNLYYKKDYHIHITFI